MAKIESVDYVAMPREAAKMRNGGETLNRLLEEVYSQIANMHNSWYGTRYQALVTDFNNMVPELNQMLKLVVTDIPSTLETIANNYARVDTGSTIVTLSEAVPKTLMALAATVDVGMRFMESDVTAVKQNVSSKFNEARDVMNQIETTLNAINWESEASQAFRTQFATLKANIVLSFENIETQFTKLITQTIADMQTTEKANTVQ